MTIKTLIHFKANTQPSGLSLVALADGSVGDTDMKFNPFTGAKLTAADATEYSDTATQLPDTDLTTAFYKVGQCKCETAVATLNKDAAHMVDYLGNVNCPECNETIKLKLSMRDRVNLAALREHLGSDEEPSEGEGEGEDEDAEEYPEDDTGEYSDEELDEGPESDSDEEDITKDAEIIAEGDEENTEPSGDLITPESDLTEEELAELEAAEAEAAKAAEESEIPVDEETLSEDEDEEYSEDDDESEDEEESDEASIMKKFRGNEKLRELSPTDIAGILDSMSDVAYDSAAPEENSEAQAKEPVAEIKSESITAEISAGENPEAVDTVRLDEKLSDSDIAFYLDPTKTKYFVTANDKPAGIIRRDLCSADTAELFERPIFEQAFRRALGTKADLKTFGYRPYSIAVNSKSLEEKVLAREVAKLRTDTASDLDNKVEKIRRCLNIVATASSKNIWPDFPNTVRDKIVHSMAQLGVQDRSLVDVAFAQAGEEYIKSLIDRAMELVGEEDAVIATKEKMVKTAIAASRPSVNPTVKNLVSGSRIVDNEEEKPKTDIASKGGEADLNGWLDTFGNIAGRR